MATFTVTTTVDENGSETVSQGMSLREAVAAANASAGADTIRFSEALSPGEITLKLGQIAVTDKLTIAGDNNSDGIADFTVSGDANGNNVADAGDTRILAVSADLSLEDINLAEGYTSDGTGGGGILLTAGALKLDNVDMNGNVVVGTGASGGAIKAIGGTVTVEDSGFNANSAIRAGGAIEIANGADVSIDASTFDGNSAGATPGNGGAIHVTAGGSIVTVADSVFTNNLAAAEGGALWNDVGSTMAISGSTITGNKATGALADNGGGGVFNNGGTLTIEGTTIAQNAATGASGSGGGILSTGGSVTIEDVTIAQNAASRAGGGIEVIDGSFVIDKSDLIGNVTGTSALGTAANPGNGGGLHVSGTMGTLVSVIDSLVSGNFAASEGGGLWNQAGSILTVENSTITQNIAAGNEADNGGGGLFNNGGALAVANTLIQANSANGGSGSGGGIFSTAGAVSILQSAIIGNDANRAGGGIEVIAGTLDLAHTDMIGNVADGGGNGPGNGGGIHITGATTTTILGGLFQDNFAALEGGALWNSATGMMSVIAARLAANLASGAAADDGGGGVFNNGGTLGLDSVAFDQNKATGAAGSGGAVFSVGGAVSVKSSTFDENTAVRAGGAVEIIGGQVAFSDNDISNNMTGGAPGNGGGVHVGTGSGAAVSFLGDRFTGNSAANQGGGLWVGGGTTVVVQDAVFTDNVALGQGGGGAIYVIGGGSLGVDGSILTGNDAPLGDAIAVSDLAGTGGVTLTNSVLLGDDVVGSAQADTILGDSGANTLVGNGGNDLLDGRGGIDVMAGGLGNDVYGVDNVADAVTELAGQGIDDVIVTTVSYTLATGQEIERLQSAKSVGTGAIDLYGNEFGNVLRGSAGANILDGRGGADALVGGAGNDTFGVDSAADKVGELAGEGTDIVISTVSYALRAGQEVEEMRFANSAWMSNLSLEGNELGNTLLGSAGANTLRGNAGADKLIGGAGRDVLIPGNDDDQDTLVYGTAAESTGLTRDVVLGMDFDDEDRFDFFFAVGEVVTAGGALSAGTFDGDVARGVDGVLTAGQGVQAVLFTPTTGDLARAGQSYLVIDANDDGAYSSADFVIQLVDSTGTLDAADFV